MNARRKLLIIVAALVAASVASGCVGDHAPPHPSQCPDNDPQLCDGGAGF